MEPTTKLIIAMLVAYAPFIWYWITTIKRITSLSDADRRKHKVEPKHYWGEG